MAKYIDLDALNKAIEDELYWNESTKAAVRAVVRTVPAADVAPVVHGKWISWEKADYFITPPDRHECSVCHDAAQVLVNGLELLSPYCPNCGAKMDLEENKNESDA